MSFIVLHSLNPEQGRARYYAVAWQPALDSGWVVERTWGPLHSSRRQHRTNQTGGLEEALILVARHLRRRLRHDYHLVDADADGQTLFTDIRG